MAGVEADAQLVRKRCTIHNRTNLLKFGADLRTLARHDLQKDGRRHFRPKDLVERISDLFNAHLYALLDMTAGMKIVHLTRRVLHALQVVPHGRKTKLLHTLLCGTGVEGIRCVGKDGLDPVLCCEVVKRRHIRRVNVLRRSPSGIACKKLKCVAAQFYRLFRHGEIALGCGQMTTDCKHSSSSYTMEIYVFRFARPISSAGILSSIPSNSILTNPS